MDAAEIDQVRWDAAEIWGQAGDAARLTEFGEALVQERAVLRKRLRNLDHRLTQVLRALALTPGRQFVEQLLRVYHAAGGSDAGAPSGPRFLASLLAEAQTLEDLLPVLSHDGGALWDELRACLFHELLLRGVDAEEIRRRSHNIHFCAPWGGLAWLPQKLADMEHGARFPRRGYSSAAGIGCPAMSSPVALDAAARRVGAGHPVTDATTVRLAEAITGPPEQGNWGAHDVGVFSTERPVTPEELPGVVASLPMECLAGLGVEDRFVFAPCSVGEVWRVLFATASGAGVYGPGVHGAYGRLSAWWSIAGLAGARPDAGPAEVEQQASACTWMRFEAGSEWFHNEINDYGIVALTPDGRRIAVLAATDTD
ncbi:DUF6183 family protein [Streptomyces cinnamoneus]|uniref:Uncharacterized protein n=1 Tax=Streptomyces cinnamoneus TaxID=53446 RepID=A0A918TE44_STRCJ|nr:DUF6183 family protein [Streptomyces cinnamoneus]GHC45282.1 hypothetical protein GCM10010507_20640 [Streptomyces cinnamoneus]